MGVDPFILTCRVKKTQLHGNKKVLSEERQCIAKFHFEPSGS
jgi:hypothetical protein